ncbi:MAG: DNA-3-methyladenine glycosylase [Synergistaceae bacterium]|jgi:DNA-3-methyladenine glycosylase|nr:DNA-3-methyladenine glycosylase [Synergistaceae bacterium]
MSLRDGDITEYRVLERRFYLSRAVTLARELLGMILVRRLPEGITAGRIVETEAYAGPLDAACHSYGRTTQDPLHRTSAMFEAGGHAYVYLIYGMYHCFNVSANAPGEPEAVLIRALEPTDGLPLMASRRGVEERELTRESGLKKLCGGPGKISMAFSIASDCNGMDLTLGGSLFIVQGERPQDSEVQATPRINVNYAGEAALYPYRFVIARSAYLSTRMYLP